MLVVPWLVNPMTIPTTIRDRIKYLLKRSRKVSLRNLVALLYIDKCHLKTASYVEDSPHEERALGKILARRTMSLARTTIHPAPQDPNVHAEQLTTLRTKSLLAVLPAISATIAVTVILPDVSGAVQAIMEPFPESTPPVQDHW